LLTEEAFLGVGGGGGEAPGLSYPHAYCSTLQLPKICLTPYQLRLASSELPYTSYHFSYRTPFLSLSCAPTRPSCASACLNSRTLPELRLSMLHLAYAIPHSVSVTPHPTHQPLISLEWYSSPHPLSASHQLFPITSELRYVQCCGSGIRCLVDLRIRDPRPGMGKIRIRDA
jgi:hypothetical protein